MKVKRQIKIIELIKNREVETQEELLDLLCRSGFNVTQATVSRDMRELKLTKVSAGDGRLKYAIYESAQKRMNERFLRVFRDGVVKIDYAGNLIVIATLEGMAMAVAACLDTFSGMDLTGGIMGTIAGDDCIFCAVKTEEAAVAVINKLNEILKSEQ
jgi:transcriptional regulator of arginine metabolism